MNIQSVAVSAIVPYAKNAKKHDKKQVKNIAESIKQYGWTQPLVLDKNNEIVIGHGRFFAAQQLKLKEVPCVYVSDLSPEQVKALRIADNKLNEAPWDIDLLREEIADLDFGSIELDFDELDDPGRVHEDDYEPVLPEEQDRSWASFISLADTESCAVTPQFLPMWRSLWAEPKRICCLRILRTT